MEVIKTAIDGVLIIEPKIWGDDRGYFFESYSARDFATKTGLDITFVQDNESKSRYGVLRGLHFQYPPYTQSKLVRVINGRVLDVAVDIRKGSPTYGQYVSCELTAENHRQFFVPKGMAHGFVVLSEEAVFQYKCDEFYHPEAEGAIAWDDKELNIQWPIPATDVVLSEKDKHHPLLKDFDSPFIYNK
jgi:dTDP-4-dehydrorhamnose 3,5-epimerase